MTRFQVGLVGAGSVARGIHVPTLARLHRSFQIANVMDADAPAARDLAQQVGARWSSSLEELLDDQRVDVVAVCTPDRMHAEHVIAACTAGKRAVLCEKPLATSRDEGLAMAHAAQDSGTHLVVGAMHVHDPAWLAATAECEDLRWNATVIRSSIVLPFNDRYEDWTSEPSRRPGPDIPVLATAEERAARLRMRILALSIHDLPLVRSFLPNWDNVSVIGTGLLKPMGYFVTLRSQDRLVELIGSFRGHWRPRWEFDAIAKRSSLHLEFPPSYVHAGSAIATIERGLDRRQFGPWEQDAYENEWLRIHGLLSAGIPPAPDDLGTIVADLTFAVRIADLASGATLAA